MKLWASSLFPLPQILKNTYIKFQIRDWLPKKQSTTVICRFLGTSPKSSGIHQTLTSVCRQIVEIYNLFPDEDIPDGFNDISLLFVKVLNAIPANSTLVLVLDSLDQLTPQNYAHKLGWIPSKLPDNVIMIVSTLPTMYGILDVLREKYGEQNLIRVPNLEDELCMDIVKMWLDNRQRTLTESQFAKAEKAFSQCSLPLYVRLVTEEVLRWHSYDPEESCVLRHTIKDVIQDLFKWLELKHGDVIVKHALAYISASKQGLGETELEDLLSLDDVVLTDVYQYHVPPTRRIPPLLWVRIRHDISSYLVTREADSIQVAFWYHRQFIESARERYLSDPSIAREVHNHMAEYYDGKWHNVKKAFKYTPAQAKKLKLDSVNSEADRRVMEQPMCYADGIYNTRKLNCLPYHLATAGQRNQLKAKCLFNYTWLLTKLKACGVHSILRDIDLIDSDKELDLLRSSINLIKSTIYLHPESLSVEIAGRLLAYTDDNHPSIQDLVKQACENGLKDNVLFPRGQLYEGPGGPLKYTLENKYMPMNDTPMCLGPGCKNLLAVNEVNELIMWDLSTGEVEKQFPLLLDHSQILNVMKVLRTFDKVHNFQSFQNAQGQEKKETVLMILACAFQTSSNPVVVIDAESGNILHSVTLDAIYNKIGFKDNLLIDLVGNELVWHIRGKSVDIFDITTGRQVKALDMEAQETQVLSSRQLMLVQLKNSAKFHLYSTKKWTKLADMELESAPDHIIPLGNSLECLMVYLKEKQVIIIDADKHLKRIGSVSMAKYIVSDIKHMVLSKDDSLLAMCCIDRFVIWNLKRNKHVYTYIVPVELKPRYKVQKTIGVFYQDKTMFVGGYEQYMIFCDLKRGNITKVLIAASAKVLVDLMVTDDSSFIISKAEKAKILKVWDLSASTEDLHEPITLTAPVRYLVSAKRTPRIAVRTFHPTESCVVDTEKRAILSYQSPDMEVMYPTISEDGGFTILRYAIGYLVSCIKIWSADTGAMVSQLAVSSISLKVFSASPDSKFIATQSEMSPTEGFQLQLWNMQTGQHIRDFDATEGGLSFMLFTKDNEFLATLQQYPQLDDGNNCTLHIYNVSTGKKVFSKSHIVKDTLYSFPPDDSLIVVFEHQPSGPEMLFLDATQNFQLVKSFPFATLPRGRLSISGDGLRASDTSLKVYEFENGTQLCQFTQTNESFIGRNPYTWPRLTYDGEYLVWVVRIEGTLYVGQVSSGEIVGTCFIHSIPYSLVVTCDNTIGIGTDEGHIMLLDLVKDASTHEAVYNRSLSLEKRGFGAGTKNSTNSKKSKNKSTTKSKMCSLL